MTGEPTLAQIEPWNELNPVKWGTTDPIGGTEWEATVDGEHKVCRAILLLNETARLVGQFNWEASPVIFGSDSMVQLFQMEWKMKLTDLANIDQTLSFFGLSYSNTATRTTQELIGFALDGANQIRTLIDDGGAEQGNSHGIYDPLLYHTFKIVIIEDTIIFYIDNDLVDTFVSAITGPMYPNFFLDTNGSGGAEIYVGKNRIFFNNDATDPYMDEFTDIKGAGFVANTDSLVNLAHIGDVDDVLDCCTDVRDVLYNRLVIDEDNSQLVLYEDDGVTEKARWNITDKDGLPVRLQGTGPANSGVELCA